MAGADLPSRSNERPFHPLSLLSVLHQRGVTFLVIGGIAARAHGSPTLTRDLDICYECSPRNLEALARALRELHAVPRGLDPALPFQLDARTLQLGDAFTLSTDAGDLDCLATPGGTRGFADLVRNAVEIELGGMTIRVAAIDDLIRMKRAAGRPKDRVELEILGALRRELERQ